MKAHNLRIPKLSLLVPIAPSKPELWAFKDKRAFFLGHPVEHRQYILCICVLQHSFGLGIGNCCNIWENLRRRRPKVGCIDQRERDKIFLWSVNMCCSGWEVHWSPVNSIKHRLEPLQTSVIQLLSAQEVSPANTTWSLSNIIHRFGWVTVDARWHVAMQGQGWCCIKAALHWSSILHPAYLSARHSTHNATLKIIDKFRSIRWRIGL